MADHVHTAIDDASNTKPKAAASPSRAGGLLRPRPKEMTPVFTVLMTMVTVDFLLLICLPFAIAYGTDSPWGDTPRLEFLGLAMLSATVYGVCASVLAEQRNHSAWWYLAGHIGAFAAPVFVAMGMVEDHWLTARLLVFGIGMIGTIATILIVQAYPRESTGEPAPMTRALGRMWHACGNIWFGIALLIVLAAAWHAGTWWEDRYGHRSAQTVFYGAWWFGALMLVFTLSIISATLRKYPWRIEQTGWIVTHIALVTLGIGSFMSFFGKVEGMMALLEGETSRTFNLDVETRLQVDEYQPNRSRSEPWRPVWSSIVQFDRDPSETIVDESFTATQAGEDLFDIKVDRFYGDAYEVVTKTNDGDRPLFAVDLSIATPNGRSQEITVAAERGKALYEMPMMAVFAYPAAWPQIVEGFKGGRDELNVGTVVIKDAAGKVLLRKKVRPGARPTGMQDPPAELTGIEDKIPGTEITVEGVAWYDNFVASNPRQDMTPGFPAFPTIIVMLKGPKGEAKRVAAAFDPSWSHEPGLLKDEYKDYRVEFEYLPATPLQPNAVYLTRYGDDKPIWAMVRRSDGERMFGELEVDKPLPLGIPLQLTPTRIYDRYHEKTHFEFNDHDPDRQTARLQIDGKPYWLQLGTATTIQKDDRFFRVRWTPTKKDLGFKLKLNDFHREFYAGARQARTFESYLTLTHEEKFPNGANIKIDMNHPLRLDGWRLFQHRFSESRDAEMTILQVNRDPGLMVTYPGCVILLLGLVIVFTQKRHYLKAMGKRLRAENANAQRIFLNSLVPVILALLATMPGVLLIVFVPEGPLLGVGVILIVLGLAIETWWVNCRLAPRWLAKPEETGTAS